MRKAFLRTGLALLGVACSDPYDAGDFRPCRRGSSRTEGQACTTDRVAITIDGREDDWQNVPTDSLDGKGVELRIARDGTAALAVFVVCPLITAEDRAKLAIELSRPGVFSNAPEDSSFYPLSDAYQYKFAGKDLGPTPIQAAVTPNGVEVRIPLDNVPYPDDVFVGIYNLTPADGGAAIMPLVETRGGPACFNARRSTNLCSN